MTCYDKSLPSPDGRCSRLWCINWLQLVALRIIHENTYIRLCILSFSLCRREDRDYEDDPGVIILFSTPHDMDQILEM